MDRPMGRSDRDLWLVILASAVAAVATCARPLPTPAAAVVGLPLVLLWPGYALTAAAFPRPAISPAERLAYSLGLSLAVAALGGFALNGSPFGLRAASWGVLLAGVAIIAASVALVRRRVPGCAPVAGTVAVPLRSRLTPWQGLLLGAAVLIAGGAIAVARAGDEGARATAFTQLWLIPSAGEVAEARLGVVNLEAEPCDYRLELWLDGRVVTVVPLRLTPGERWETTVLLPMGPPDGLAVEARLYRAETPDQPYRTVRSTLRR
jgi:uncharacterized membrane protein